MRASEGRATGMGEDMKNSRGTDESFKQCLLISFARGMCEVTSLKYHSFG